LDDMKAMLCIAALAALCAPAAAQVRYDLKLERAAMEIIARKIGDIRPTLYTEAPARRVVADEVRRPGPAPHAPVVGPSAEPRGVHGAWWELRGAADGATVSAGSFQSFADGAGAHPEHRPAGIRPVSRIADF